MECPFLFVSTLVTSYSPDSPYRTAISGAVLKLQEEGKLHILKTRWWKEKRGGGSCRVIRILHHHPSIHFPRTDKNYIQCSSPSSLSSLSVCLALPSQDDTSKSSSTANELGLANVGGVFVVLMGGMGVACVIAVCEFVWKSRKVAVEERVSGSEGKRLIFGPRNLHLSPLSALENSKLRLGRNVPMKSSSEIWKGTTAAK